MQIRSYESETDSDSDIIDDNNDSNNDNSDIEDIEMSLRRYIFQNFKIFS